MPKKKVKTKAKAKPKAGAEVKLKTRPSDEELEAQGYVVAHNRWWPPLHLLAQQSGMKLDPRFLASMPDNLREAWHQFFIERACLLDKDKCYAGKYQHFRNIIAIILDRPECTYKFTWNPYAERMLKALCSGHRFIAFAGHASSGKTQMGAVWALFNFLLWPESTKVILTSTTLEDSRARVFGVTEKYWKQMCDFFGGEQYMPGKLVSSRGVIKSTVSGKPSQLEGIQLMAGGKGQDASAATKIGFKAKNFIVVADELPLLTDEFYKNAMSNLSANENLQFIGIGNPTSYYDPFGVLTTPVDGWNSISEQDLEWPIKDGICLRFDGENSPNVKAGYKKYEGLITIEQIENWKTTLGESSAEFYRMVKAFYSPTGERDCIYSAQEIVKYMADKNITVAGWWQSSPDMILTLDPAFAYDGDRAPATLSKVGFATDPSFQLTQKVLELVMQERLGEDVMDKENDRNEQIIKQFVALIRKYKIPTRNVGIDATGGGAVFATLLAREIGMGFLNVRFSEAPTQFQVSRLDKRTGKEMFANRVSELWYVSKDLIKSGQIKGLTPDLIKEITARTYTNVGGKVKVESKKDMKKRIAKSPDLGDSFFIGVDLAKQRFGLTSNVRASTPIVDPRLAMRRKMIVEPTLGTLSYSGSGGWAE